MKVWLGSGGIPNNLLHMPHPFILSLTKRWLTGTCNPLPSCPYQNWFYSILMPCLSKCVHEPVSLGIVRNAVSWVPPPDVFFQKSASWQDAQMAQVHYSLRRCTLRESQESLRPILHPQGHLWSAAIPWCAGHLLCVADNTRCCYMVDLLDEHPLQS